MRNAALPSLPGSWRFFLNLSMSLHGTWNVYGTLAPRRSVWSSARCTSAGALSTAEHVSPGPHVGSMAELNKSTWYDGWSRYGSTMSCAEYNSTAAAVIRLGSRLFGSRNMNTGSAFDVEIGVPPTSPPGVVWNEPA